MNNNNDSDSDISNLRITFSHTCTEAETLKPLLLSAGARIYKTLAKSTTHFVQSYHDDDDDRLAEAFHKRIQVVPPTYIEACLSSGTVLDFPKWALSGGLEAYTGPLGDLGSPIPVFDLESPCVSSMFADPPREMREEDELPQTVESFAVMDRLAPTPASSVFVLRPIGHSPSTPAWTTKTRSTMGGKSLSVVAQFVAAFFGVPVRVEDPIPFDGSDLIMGPYAYPLRTRVAPPGGDAGLAFHAMDAIAVLDENKPDDAFCLVGLAADDIYEAEDGDEIEGVLLGRATGDGAGVVSTARLGNPDGSGLHPPGFAEFLSTLVHEASHMLGLDHCPFFACTMAAIMPDYSAGAAAGDDNDNDDDDSLPYDLCPMCLAKLCIAIPSLNLLDRYTSLARLSSQIPGLERHALWFTRMLTHLQPTTPTA